MVDTLLRRQLLQIHFNFEFSNDEKKVLKWRNTLPRQVKSYIEIVLNMPK